ncbi:hypothetical protein WI26_26440 [Burkholderia diffusa]|nr:hypothetical protein WI26_26440 [Burkholderia diffusa]
MSAAELLLLEFLRINQRRLVEMAVLYGKLVCAHIRLASFAAHGAMVGSASTWLHRGERTNALHW